MQSKLLIGDCESDSSYYQLLNIAVCKLASVAEMVSFGQLLNVHSQMAL